MGILKTKIFLALAFFPSDQAENKAFYTLSKPTQGGGVGKVFTLTNQQTSAVFLSPPLSGYHEIEYLLYFPTFGFTEKHYPFDIWKNRKLGWIPDKTKKGKREIERWEYSRVFAPRKNCWHC